MARKDLQRVNTCKNLLQRYTLDELSFMISQGTFDDIYVGDYIDMEMTTNLGTEEEPNNVTETVRWLVGGIDMFKSIYSTNYDGTATNNILLIPSKGFKTLHKMNEGNITTNGFLGSDMWTKVLPKYNTAITNSFGASHILEHKRYLSSTSVGSGTSCSITLTSGVKLLLMNEIECFGCNIKNKAPTSNTDCQNIQFPIFAQLPETKKNPTYLRDMADSSQFTFNPLTMFKLYNVGSSQLLIRPYFLFK